jgi:hypothetical protein
MTRPFCPVLIATALTAGPGGCVSAQQLRQQDVAAAADPAMSGSVRRETVTAAKLPAAPIDLRR